MYNEEEEEDWSLGARGHLGKPGLRAGGASSRLPPQASLTAAPQIKSLSYASAANSQISYASADNSQNLKL